MPQVMIVDDDPDIREEIASALVSEGYDVSEASDGAEALAALDRAKPSLVLLDMMMPRMNGNEFLDEVALRPDLREIPIVVVSAYPGEVRRGARKIVPKPISLSALLGVVAEYCGG
jgi:CheY-like chemotaxis protein